MMLEKTGLPEQAFEIQPLSGDVQKITQEYMTKHGTKSVSTGMVGMDKLLNGGLYKGLTVIGAASGLGKSTLMLQMAQSMSGQGEKVLYFSLEMPRQYIVAKALSRQYFKDQGENKRKALSASDLLSPTKAKKRSKRIWDLLEKSKATLTKELENLYIIEELPSENASEGDGMPKVPTAKDIYRIATAFQKKHCKEGKPPIVMVDYLQLLSCGDADIKDIRRNVEKVIAYMSNLSKRMPVVLISSIARTSYTKNLELGSLKESGMIEFSADVIWGLSFAGETAKGGRKQSIDSEKEKGKTPREVALTILKNRYGVCGNNARVQLQYYAEFDYFKEVEKASPNVEPSPVDVAEGPHTKTGDQGRVLR